MTDRTTPAWKYPILTDCRYSYCLLNWFFPRRWIRHHPTCPRY